MLVYYLDERGDSSIGRVYNLHLYDNGSIPFHSSFIFSLTFWQERLAIK